VTAPAVTRTNRIERLVQTAPPPKPACFSTLQSWQAWLLDAIETGEPITRLKDTGKYAGKRVVMLVFEAHIDHCTDCTREHRGTMKRLGKCQPAQPLEASALVVQNAGRPREAVAATV
jgi:hypothetical protein